MDKKIPKKSYGNHICEKCKRTTPIYSCLKLVRCTFKDCYYRFENPYSYFNKKK